MSTHPHPSLLDATCRHEFRPCVEPIVDVDVDQCWSTFVSTIGSTKGRNSRRHVASKSDGCGWVDIYIKIHIYLQFFNKIYKFKIEFFFPKIFLRRVSLLVLSAAPTQRTPPRGTDDLSVQFACWQKILYMENGAILYLRVLN